MSNTKKRILALAIMVFAFFGSDINITNLLSIIKPEPPAAKILNIDTPSEKVINRVQIFSDIITDPDDRAKVAIFNYEFANRILNYNCNIQQTNDVYSFAGKSFFKEEIKGKYENLAPELVKLFKEIVGEDNYIISDEKKSSLHDYFKGIAWGLIKKR